MSLSPAMASAMLSGIDSQHVVTGQYTDGDGGACPLLAANRAGAPLHQVTSFPKIWDHFCGLSSYRQARKATRHELHMLKMLLMARVMPASERVLDIKPAMPEHTPRFRPPRSRKLGQEADWQQQLSELLRRADQQIVRSVA